MEFSELIRARHSVRLFEATPIAKDVLTAVVADAQRAPSWVNAQEWQVIITTGAKLDAIRRRYAERTAAGIKGASDFPPAHREDWSDYAQDNMKAFSESRTAAGLDEVKIASQTELFHAPAVAYLLLPRKTNRWAILDLGGFEAMLCLAAADRGLGSVPAYNLVKYPDILREELGVTDNMQFAIGIALGYEADHALNRFRSVRRPVSDYLRFAQ